MASEPSSKKAVLFIDDQNLFYAAKEAFGYTYPNYDPKKLEDCAGEASLDSDCQRVSRQSHLQEPVGHQ